MFLKLLCHVYDCHTIKIRHKCINARDDNMHNLDVWFTTKLRNAEQLLELLIVCILTIYNKYR